MKDVTKLRPYAINLDWLQLCVWQSSEGEWWNSPMFYHHHVPKEHGSKVFKYIIDVYDSDGCQLGNLSCCPHSSAINLHICIFKAENELLYRANAIERIFAYFADAGLKYRNITRMDIAYDSHELYEGRSWQNFLNGYLHNKYLKLGNNNPLVYYIGGYTMKKSSSGKSIYNEENGGKFLVNSITWGSRSSDVVVQVYNKSRELREQKFKAYIVDYWEACGLKPAEKDVYRCEIRISGGKVVRNHLNKNDFKLSVADIMMHEQVEHLFAAFAERYMVFYLNDKKITHKERLPRIDIFSYNYTPVFRPIHVAGKKNPQRMVKIMYNYTYKLLREAKKQGDDVANELERLLTFFDDAYDFAKYYNLMPANYKPQLLVRTRGAENDIDRYADLMQGADDDFIVRCIANDQHIQCAEALREEEEQRAIIEKLRWESADPSPAWRKDLREYLRARSCPLDVLDEKDTPPERAEAIPVEFPNTLFD